MKHPESSEGEISGKWLFHDGSVWRDEACERIDWLTQHYLKRIASTHSGWEILFQDPQDGRLWECTYPHGEMQGGGPPRPHVINAEEAHSKYQLE